MIHYNVTSNAVQELFVTHKCYKSANTSETLGDILFTHDIWNESSEVRTSCKTENF